MEQERKIVVRYAHLAPSCSLGIIIIKGRYRKIVLQKFLGLIEANGSVFCVDGTFAYYCTTINVWHPIISVVIPCPNLSTFLFVCNPWGPSCVIIYLATVTQFDIKGFFYFFFFTFFFLFLIYHVNRYAGVVVTPQHTLHNMLV